MIGLSTPTFDIDGSINFQTISANSQTRNVSRRVSKKQTLDAGVYVTDNGYVDGDRDFIIILNNIKKADADLLQRLVKSYSVLYLSTEGGFFKVAPESYIQDASKVTLRLLGVELLS